MGKRQARNTKQLKRKSCTREPYDRVLIVCEGEKTEFTYFKELCNHYSLSSANIAVISTGSDPRSLVEKAKNLQDAEKKQGEKYDKIHCVFDRDTHATFDSACDQAKQNNFQITDSWPCFEYWLLLHFAYNRKPFLPGTGKTASENCIKEFIEKLPNYQKNMPDTFKILFSQLENAKKNSKTALKDAKNTKEYNPSTKVHLLVEYLQQLKK